MTINCGQSEELNRITYCCLSW